MVSLLDEYMAANDVDPAHLEHYGVKGMKWGVRKKTDDDPDAGRARRRRIAKGVAIGVGVGALAIGTTYLVKSRGITKTAIKNVPAPSQQAKTFVNDFATKAPVRQTFVPSESVTNHPRNVARRIEVQKIDRVLSADQQARRQWLADNKQIIKDIDAMMSKAKTDRVRIDDITRADTALAKDLLDGI